MKNPDTSIIDQPWPENELEHVDACPYCNSKERTLAYKDVQDWSFYCARGNWSYWDCSQCQTLYLDPRPKKSSIWMAYSVYYTHSTSRLRKFYVILRERLRNECWFVWYNIDVTPRIGVPIALQWLLLPLKQRLAEPFLQIQLSRLPRGKLLDIGCGDGKVMEHAQQLGWDVVGVEIDPEAVRVAKNAGLNVIEADYDQVNKFSEQFDCVICSHVLEHLHQPMDLLERIKQVLKPGGYVLLVLPNSLSTVRMQFGKYWRGLESPRHLGIPSSFSILNTMRRVGFDAVLMNTSHKETYAESERIARQNHAPTTREIPLSELHIRTQPFNSHIWDSDFTKILAQKL